MYLLNLLFYGQDIRIDFSILLSIYNMCAKLFMLFDVSDIEFPPIVFFSLTGRSYVYFNTIGVFFQLIGKPFSNHATIAWFFFISKKGTPILFGVPAHGADSGICKKRSDGTAIAAQGRRSRHVISIIPLSR